MRPRSQLAPNGKVYRPSLRSAFVVAQSGAVTQNRVTELPAQQGCEICSDEDGHPGSAQIFNSHWIA